MDFEHNPFFKRFTHFNLTMNGVYEHFYLFNFEIRKQNFTKNLEYPFLAK